MNGAEERQVPALPLVELDEAGVSTLLKEWGFPFYERQIKEHGITGEILIHLDHEALKDVGIHSVGQRLAILKAVYALKIDQNVPVEEGHYVPPSEDMDVEEGLGGALPRRQILGLLNERDDRIRNLEYEVQRLHESIIQVRDEALSRSLSKPSSRAGVRSPTGALFPHPLSNTSTLSRSNSASRPRTTPDSSGLLPDSPRSPMDSPRMNEEEAAARSPHGLHAQGGEFAVPPFTSGALTPTTPTGPTSSSTDPMPQTANSLNVNGLSNSHGSSNSNGSSTLPSSTLTVGGSSRPTTGDKSKSGERQHASRDANTADNPYRSFRVTLEDPCYKVLPAALKKYKINDDWRQYALFICYDNTERCLAYDEKPLLLFQKLKESNSNPVFMLRHIKDIKSPIAVASAKHALRRDKRAANAGAGLDKPPATDRSGAIIPPQKITRLHLPPVLLPLGKDKEKEEGEEEGSTKPPPSPREAPGYCISIYPYLAEREDEFDVAVGDTFVIISKTKGWWVVHRDLGPLGASDLSTRKSAWVPAGCLLETNVPPLSLTDGTTAPNSGGSPYNASNVPIEPQYIVSVSTLGVALMDYAKVGSDELEVKKGTPLRILKRYNHWSYAIREDGQRGWLPSWFCGRTNRDGTPTTPTTASEARNGSATTSILKKEEPVVSEAKIVSIPAQTTVEF